MRKKKKKEDIKSVNCYFTFFFSAFQIYEKKNYFTFTNSANSGFFIFNSSTIFKAGLINNSSLFFSVSWINSFPVVMREEACWSFKLSTSFLPVSTISKSFSFGIVGSVGDIASFFLFESTLIDCAFGED